MSLSRSFIILFSAHLFLFGACQHDKVENEKQMTTVDSLAADSDALVLSLTPTVGCLPLYYAQRSGIFKTLGLKVCLKTYQSQFDCDTAVLGRTAVGGTSDLLRLHYYANKGQMLSAVTSLDGTWSLLSSGSLRIKKMSLLEGRTMAVARFSSSDYYSEAFLRASGMEYEEVMRPQINDYSLRASMLKNHQVDAAVLPEPFVTKAKLAGHKELYRTKDTDERLGCLLFKPSVLANADSAKLVKRILKGYNLAVAELNEKGKNACSEILQKDYKLSKEVIDSLTIPNFEIAAMPSRTEVEKAQKFLRIRSRWNHDGTLGVLFNEKFLPK